MLTLYLLRHGESEENVARVFSARKGDPPLSPRGVAQIVQQAERLAACDLTALYASPLCRARQSAALVAQRCGLEPRLSAALLEVDVGLLDGAPLDDPPRHALYEQVVHDWEQGRAESGFPGGETLHDIEARLRVFLEPLERPGAGRVLIVGHSLFFAVALWLLCSERAPTIRDYRMQRGHLSVLDQTPDGYRLRAFNLAPGAPNDSHGIAPFPCAYARSMRRSTVSEPRFKSPLHEMVCTTPTTYWNDSCSIEELTYAIEHGAVGATANPVIVGTVLKKELPLWKERIAALIRERPTVGEEELAWALIEEMSAKAAALLRPAFEASGGRNGRLSIQVDPRRFRDTDAMVAQAEHFNTLAPNMIVKIPATCAGIPAIEEATYRGISINATVSFSVPQALAVAEAVERGFRRREAEGREIQSMGPVCTIMVGRLDDWLKLLAERDGIIANPCATEWAGVAVMKRAYRLYRERGYRLRLLAAAYRNHLHWSEFVGGDVVISPPSQWQKRFNASDVRPIPRMDNPVPPEILEELCRKFADFRRAYEPDGMTVEEFDTFGPTRRTLRQFIAAYADLVAFLRDFLLPNPDVAA